MRVVLSIAGSDSSAGAGIQADLKAIAACGGYGATALTAVTAQNSRGVQRVEILAPEIIAAQIESVCSDLDVAAVKTGMLGNAGVVEAVAGMLRRFAPRRLVVDPVMVSKSGHALLSADAVAALRARILPLASLVTPNRHEARALTGIDARDAAGAAAAGRALLEAGCQAALVKGGHADGDEAIDVLVTPDGVHEFAAPRLETPHTHGTGCTLAAAIATFLARGWELHAAVAAAKSYVTDAIRGGLALGAGHGPTDHFVRLRHAMPDRRTRDVGRLHVLTDMQLQADFDHAEIARRAARGGADVVQVRDKTCTTRALAAHVMAVRRAVAGTQACVLVDDRADVAAACGTDGVHLGPEDLDAGGARRILGPRALVGATANDLEAARRTFHLPIDYLGVGPVFGTTSKHKPAPVLGPDALAAIARESPVPVVAIGGITPERVAEVLDAGAHGVAVLSGVVGARDPEAATALYRTAIDAWLAAHVEVAR